MRVTIWERIGPNLWSNPSRTDYLSLGDEHPLYEGKPGVVLAQRGAGDGFFLGQETVEQLFELLANAQVESELARKMATRAEAKLWEVIDLVQAMYPQVWETDNWPDRQ